MKARFFAIAALVLGMASCAKDFAPEANLGGEVDFTLAVSAPELAATRAGEFGENDGVNGHNSAYGAIDYLSDAEWENVDLRYTLEIYDANEDGSLKLVDGKPVLVKDRYVEVVDEYTAVTFETRLAPKRNYRFVVFADFVAEGATAWSEAEKLTNPGLRHSFAKSLTNIELINEDINDEASDAYFAFKKVFPSNNTHNTDAITLTRPYGKLRVVATDLHELNLNVKPGSVKVVYNACNVNTFNAVEGTIDFEYKYKTNEFDYDYVKEGIVYTEGKDALKNEKDRNTHMTIFTDYILASDTQHTIKFNMLVNDEDGNPIKETVFNTEIPVQRNHLTTIIGNVLTTATDVEVSIDDNFASEYNEEGVNVKERILLETLINGGVFDLTEDLTITAPTWLKGDAVIRLNGYTLTYDIPTDKESDNNYAIMTRVENGSTLTFKGEGNVVSEGYIASVNAGGVLNISEGAFESEGCTVFQSNGGEINISGGEFKAAEYNGDHRYTINFVDSKKQDGLIEISGGRFYKYNPSESNSENPAMDFCKNGYWATEDGDWYVVEKAMEGWYDEAANKVVAYSANDLLKWSWVVANKSNSCSLDVMRNITLPMYTVEEDKANETYKYTSTPVTISNGVPSGSNWPQVGTWVPKNIYYDGIVEGNNHVISNITMLSDALITGFIGRMYNGEVHNLTFNNATIYSTSQYVAPIAYAEDGAYISNVHTTNSYIRGTGYVAGLVAEAQDRYNRATHEDDGRQRNMPATLIENCTVDANTVVYGTGANVGGLVGQHYGAILYNCSSKANVTGTDNVGGLVGEMWAYFADMHAYIINCSCTGAVITANNSVGGILGKSRVDVQNHSYATNYIVGCACDVTINCSGKNVGAIVGYNSNSATYTSIIGSYAISNLPVIAAGNVKAETSFSVATDVTAEQIAKMNEGIAEYNAFAAAYVFPYTTPCQHDVLLPQAKLW